MKRKSVDLFVVDHSQANRPNKTHREQAADLLLLDHCDHHLVFSSPIVANPDGSMSFEVRQSTPGGDRYKITVSIEEI